MRDSSVSLSRRLRADQACISTDSMRFYPHDQDTGGFFVTVLEKKADAPLEDVKSGEATGASTAAAEDVAMDPHEAEPIEEQPCAKSTTFSGP